jgi:hypothetical protein
MNGNSRFRPAPPYARRWRPAGCARWFRAPTWETPPWACGGRKAGLEDVLRYRDRVEIYRPLQVDPKLARRERFRKQGVRAAGLFARRKAD